MKRTSRLKPDKDSRNYARAIYLLTMKRVRGEISPAEEHRIKGDVGHSTSNGTLAVWEQEFDEPLWD